MPNFRFKDSSFLSIKPSIKEKINSFLGSVSDQAKADLVTDLVEYLEFSERLGQYHITLLDVSDDLYYAFYEEAIKKSMHGRKIDISFTTSYDALRYTDLLFVPEHRIYETVYLRKFCSPNTLIVTENESGIFRQDVDANLISKFGKLEIYPNRQLIRKEGWSSVQVA